MIIFKDIISDKEVLSDIFKLEYPEEFDKQIIKVVGKLKTETTKVDDSMFGGNKSAEGAGEDEGADDAASSGVDCLMNSQMEAEQSFTKKQFLVYLKEKMKDVTEKMKENGKSQEVIDAYKKGTEKFVKAEVIPKFKEFQFFLNTDDVNLEGVVNFVIWEGSDPICYYVKEALIPEKC